MKEKDEKEFEQLSVILNYEIIKNNIDLFKDILKEHFKTLEYNPEKYPKYIRIIWIINGFLNDKNQMIVDWFSNIKSLFVEYDNLKAEFQQINFNSGNSGGLEQIENLIANYTIKDGNAPFEKQGKEKVEVIYNTPELLVVAPTTQKSCIYWGDKTEWCVSRYKPNDPDPFGQNLFYRY